MNPIIYVGLSENIMPIEDKEMKDRIINSVSEVLKISVEKLSLRRRNRPIINARRMVCFYLCSQTNYSLTKIGSIFKYSHATVLHHKRTYQNLLDTDKETKEVDRLLRMRLNLYINQEMVSKRETAGNFSM